MGDAPFRERTNDRRVGALLLLGLVVLFGGLYVAGYLFTSEKVPRGATVEDVRIGGLRPAAAVAKLETELGPRAEDPIVVSADGKRYRMTAEEAGLRVDYQESVAQAGGGKSWDPARMWDYVTGGDDYEAVVDVDDEALATEIATFADEVDIPAVEGGITFKNGRATPTYPKTGLAVDREGAAEEVLSSFLRPEPIVPLPVQDVRPSVPAKKIRAAMNRFANPAMSGPVVVQIDRKEVILRPRQYSKALSMKAQNGTLVPELDPKSFMKAIKPAMRKVSLQPKPASVQLVDGRPKVIPHQNGRTFDAQAMEEQFLTVLTKQGKNRTLRVKSKVDRPDFTTNKARKLGIKEVVSEYTTYFPHADYRNVNLGRAAEIVNGTVLKPGETFSLNDTVGERTAENGFAKGFIISNGVYKEDYGGGVSQVATTLFNAAFFAGLEDVEHKPHSFYIDRYPIGREATVVWGAVDLRFKNDTPHGILIQSWVNPSTPSSQGSMNVKMWSTKHWDITAGVSDRYNLTQEKTRYIDSPECVPNEGYGGFDIDVYRYFRKPGSDELVRKETMKTTYTPSDTVVCSKDPNA